MCDAFCVSAETGHPPLPGLLLHWLIEGSSFAPFQLHRDHRGLCVRNFTTEAQRTRRFSGVPRGQPFLLVHRVLCFGGDRSATDAGAIAPLVNRGELFCTISATPRPPRPLREKFHHRGTKDAKVFRGTLGSTFAVVRNGAAELHPRKCAFPQAARSRLLRFNGAADLHPRK